MHGNIPAEAQRSIFPADSSDSKNSSQTFTDSSDSKSCRWFVEMARKLWPQKTAASLAFLTKARERQCYRYVSGEQEPPAALIVALLHSADGERFLDQLMLGSNAEWNRSRVADRTARAGVAVLARQLGLFK